MLVEEDVDQQHIDVPAMLSVYDHKARQQLSTMDVEHELKIGQRYVINNEDGTKSLVWDVIDVRSLA